METVNFQELQSFAAVARYGGITAAAKELGIAKSAVSKHVTQLERRLGVVLLLRATRRVSLTSEGEHLLPRINSLLAESQRLIEEAQEEVVIPEGEVHLAATPEFGSLLARSFLPQLCDTYPRLKISMKTRYDHEDMQSSAFDLAFKVGSVADDQLVARRLGSFRRIVVAAPDWPGLADIQHPSDLESAQCLLFSAPSHQAEWNFETQNADDAPLKTQVRGTLAVRNFNILAELAEGGRGIAWLPNYIVRPALEAGRLVNVLPDWPSPERPLILAYRPGAERISRLKAVIDLARTSLPSQLE